MVRHWPSREGRYGVRQFDVLTGEQSGGTVWMGWATREQAEAANPDTEAWRFEVFDRWPYLEEGDRLDIQRSSRSVETVQTSLFDAA